MQNLNAQYWLHTHSPPSTAPTDLSRLPRFDETHERFWVLVQIIGRLGLHHTLQRTLKGRRGVNEGFMTWDPPPELLGREAEVR